MNLMLETRCNEPNQSGKRLIVQPNVVERFHGEIRFDGARRSSAGMASARADNAPSRLGFMGRSSDGLRRLHFASGPDSGYALGLKEGFGVALPGFRLVRERPTRASVMVRLVPEGQLQMGACNCPPGSPSSRCRGL